MTSVADLDGVESLYGALEVWNRFLRRFYIAFSGANFFSAPLHRRAILSPSRLVAPLIEHRCILKGRTFF